VGRSAVRIGEGNPPRSHVWFSDSRAYPRSARVERRDNHLGFPQPPSATEISRCLVGERATQKFQVDLSVTWHEVQRLSLGGHGTGGVGVLAGTVRPTEPCHICGPSLAALPQWDGGYCHACLLSLGASE
jgi:hypothetical protein